MTIYVLSESSIKISAVREFFNRSTDIHAISIDNIIKEFNLHPLPPQPINNSGPYCALTRIQYFKEFMKFKKNNVYNDLIISIENFINTETHRDLCCFAIEYKGQSTYAISIDMPALFPSEFLEHLGEKIKFYTGYEYPDATSLEGYQTTVGQYINSMDPDIPANDWMIKFNPLITRNKQIRNAYTRLDYVAFLAKFIEHVPNFPKEGIVFQNILPLLSDNFLFRVLLDELVAKLIDTDFKFDYIVGLESRGFLLAGPLADRLNCGLVTVRKAGKLPTASYKVSYEKEYGSDTFEIPKNSIKKDANILIVDDILATGGTLNAAKILVDNFQPKNIKYLVLCSVKECQEKAKEILGNSYSDVIVIFK